MCGEFCHQFRVLAWKNATLKLRSLTTLFLEIVAPVIIILILGSLSKSLYRSTTEQTFPDQYNRNAPFNFLYQIRCNDNLVLLCKACGTESGNGNGEGCQARYIAVAPSAGSDSSANIAAQELVMFANSLTSQYSNSTFKYFASEEDFLSVINYGLYSIDDSLPIYSSAVIINSGFPNWDYVLRLNQTYNNYDEFLPPTNIPNLDLSIKGPKDATYISSYLDSGYFALADVVTSFVASSTCQRTPGKCSNDEFVYTQLNGIADFPNAKYINAGFWTNIGFIFGLLMIIAFCLPIANVIVYLVQEKESKMRESMYMMAMRSDALWLSWLFHFLCLFVPLSILLTFAGTLLFEYSSGVYVFFYFMTFFLASISYCVFISTLFNKARSAAVVGCLLFFAGYIIYIGVNFGTTITRSAVLGASIHPAAAFCFAALSFQTYEDSNIGITSFTWTTRGDTVPVSFQDTLNMLFIDIFIYAALAWYTSQTYPSEYGTHKPWYFLFMPSYWSSVFSTCCRSCGFGSSGVAYDNVKSQALSDGDVEMASSNNSNTVEEVSQALRDQVAAKTCIDIRGLVKEFTTTTGIKRAVDDLNLTIYSGEITALLGHNGAGKTTTMAMLTGLIPIDSGSAVIEGHDVSTDIDKIRRNLGVCPQHDILYPLLTVEEHLILFASFKGVPNKELRQEVENMIQIVGLTEKRKQYSKNLSGGQKRKLSVGIAFIGGSRVVLLDEPTSGMDPYSRRFTWNLIRQQKKGRIVVLTTHFMDEADLLGDRVAIMGDGKLRCCGTSLYLKTKFGLGYSLTIEKQDAVKFNSEAVSMLLKDRIQDTNLLNDVGKEIVFQLPFSSSALFQSLFEYFDKNSQELGIASYGVSVTTLEEVFITVQNGTETQAQAEEGRNHSTPVAIVKGDDDATPTGVAFAVEASPVKIDEASFLNYYSKHFLALFLKRLLYFCRDWKSWIFLYLVPFLFILGGLLVMLLTTINTDQPLKKLDIRVYNSNIGNQYLPTPFSNNPYFCGKEIDPKSGSQSDVCHRTSLQKDIMSSFPKHSNYPTIPGSNITSIYDMSNFLYDSRDKYQAAQYGGVSFLESFFGSNESSSALISYVVHANYTATHAAPMFQAVVANAIISFLDPTATLQVSMHPLPYTKQENIVSNNFDSSIIALFILLAISVIPASFATHIVREREVKAKHQQIVSGVSYPMYWISNFVWDITSYIPTEIMFVVLIISFPHTNVFSGLQGQLSAFIVLLFMFGVSTTSFTYLLSFLFKTPSGAQISCILMNFIAGLILSIVGFALRLSGGETRSIFMDVLRYLFCLLPPFALGDGLYSLALIDFYSLLELTGDETYGTFDWDISGLNICFMAWTSIVYLILCIVAEYILMNRDFNAIISKFMRIELPADGKCVKDDDVLAEEDRINSLDQATANETNSILIKDFKHVYPGGKYAVKGISLGIPNGECFGLLGINGAGKSTTLSMLSGEFIPTTGEVYLAGLNLLEEAQKCRRKIGFCPQFDSILELLTAREHLQLYARIKGIVEADINRVVNAKIAEMGLTEYADRAAGTYSGGNKRKLSVAIAMIGEPSIVFLDEPSTGMDPVARRFMWRVISDIVTKREKCSLILTTHSMEECEALCTRIGIMVGGALRCLGSGQRLRSKYGSGYQIEVGFVNPGEEEITIKSKEMLNAIGSQGARGIHTEVTSSEVEAAFNALGKPSWHRRLIADGGIVFDKADHVTLINVVVWFLLEEKVEYLLSFFTANFGQIQVRERQINKVRVELSAFIEDGVTRRPLSSIFGTVEGNKDMLGVLDYSISQTSLEQIFNQFAAQQEEETGAVAGIVTLPVAARVEEV